MTRPSMPPWRAFSPRRERNGKAAGFLATDLAMARAWRAKGFRCLSYGIDIGLLQTALAEGIGALRNDEA